MKTEKLIDELQALDIREVEEGEIGCMIMPNIDEKMKARFGQD